MEQKSRQIRTTSLQIQKIYLPFASNHPRRRLRNISEIFFCLARRICTIAEEEDTRLKRLSELNPSLKQQKIYCFNRK